MSKSSSPYPRGVPFKAPLEPTELEAALEQAREREAQLKRWMLGLGLGVVGVVVLALGIGGFFLVQAMRQIDRVAARDRPTVSALSAENRYSEPPAATVEPRPSPRGDLKIRVADAEARLDALKMRFKEAEEAVQNQQDGKNKKLLEEKLKEARDQRDIVQQEVNKLYDDVKNTAVPKGEPSASPTSPRDRSLEAIGGLTGAHLYQSYLNLGMLADAAENEVYTEAEATKLLSTISTLMDTVDGQLNRLADANPDPDELRKLGQVRAITALLRTQAKELKLYWETEEKDVSALKDHQAKFHKAREDAWIGIKDMLGIQE